MTIAETASAEPAVPGRYRGVWRRTLLQADGMRDTTTTVLWLQTARWHADIRIPAHRPDFSGIRRFADCDPARRAWLARQQGFAGTTTVDTGPLQDICTWHRRLDYQPPAVSPDAGRITFEGSRLIETGLHADYLEHWQREPDSDGGFAVLRKITAEGACVHPVELLLLAGRHVMHVRDRGVVWPAAVKPGMTLGYLPAPQQMGLLDFVVSYGHRTRTGWHVLHSTLPWREGAAIDLRLDGLHDGIATMRWDGTAAFWQALEWAPPA